MRLTTLVWSPVVRGVQTRPAFPVAHVTNVSKEQSQPQPVFDRAAINLRERDRVSFDHFDRQHLKRWMTWMIDQRHYATKTVALRLSAIKAFLSYSAHEDLTLVALSQAAKALKAPAHPKTPIEYFTESQTRAILVAFTGQTAKSRRNRMLLILLYDTAARVGEITGLTLGRTSPSTIPDTSPSPARATRPASCP